jgi:hypothetical protein
MALPLNKATHTKSPGYLWQDYQIWGFSHNLHPTEPVRCVLRTVDEGRILR